MKLLHDHYLGPNNVQHMALQARTKLQNTHYTGEKPRWNFEKFVRVQVQQHIVLESLVSYGYSGIDEPTKVQYLLDGVKTDKLETVRTTILSSALLRSNFNSCVTLMQDYIRQDKSNQPRVQVAVVRAGRGGGRGRGGRTSGRGSGFNNHDKKKRAAEFESVPNRYYTSEEYKELTTPQRNFLRLQRQKEKEKKEVKVASLSAQVSELTIASAATAKTAKKRKRSVTYDSQVEKSDSNRSNRALSRQRVAESDTDSE